MIKFSALTVLCLLSFSSSALQVIIDAGHGGKDKGAVDGSLKESDLTLAIAQKLAQLLETDSHFQHTLTRQGDAFLRLSERVQGARLAKDAVYISIHANSSTDPRAQGMEVYFQNQLPPDEESMLQADRENHGEEGSHELGALDPLENLSLPDVDSVEVREILRDMVRNERIQRSSRLAVQVRKNWRGQQRSKANSIRQAPFFVISNTNVPSVLVEVGYVTHPEEGARLRTSAYQQLMAQSLYSALQRYKEEVDKL